MGKQKTTPTFGTNLQEVDSNIAAMNAEREELAKKQGTKDFDNARFEELTNNLVQANRQRSQYSGDVGLQSTGQFTEQRTTVPPVQLGQQPIAQTEAAQSTGSLLGDINPGAAEVVGAQSGMVPNDLSALGTGQPQTGLNTVPESGSGNIIQSVLAGIDRTRGNGIGSQINQAMFGQPGGYRRQPAVDIGAGDLFFAAGEPIQKGTVSGQIIGNQPIFVGGADYFPTQVLARRQKALEDAAIAQKQAEQELLNRKAPLVKDKGFQKSLTQQYNTQFNQFVDQAREQYGDQWADALKDQTTPIGREFVQFTDNMDFIAASADQTTDEIAKIREGVETGDLVYSPETLQLLDDYENLQGQFAGGNIAGSVNLREEFGKLQGNIGLDKFLNDQNIDVKGTVTGYANVIDKGEYFETVEQKKTAYEDQLRGLAADWARPGSPLYPSVRSGLITEEQIFNHLNDLYGYENVVNKSVTNKPSGGDGRITINMADLQTQNNKAINVPGTDAQGNTVSYQYNVLGETPIQTKLAPKDFAGAQVYNQNGQLVNLEEGISNIDVNSLSVVEVINPATGQKEAKKVIVGTAKTKVPVTNPETGVITYNEINRPVVMDYDSQQARVKTEIATPDAAEAWEKNANNMINNYKDTTPAVVQESITGGGTVKPDLIGTGKVR